MFVFVTCNNKVTMEEEIVIVAEMTGVSGVREGRGQCQDAGGRLS